MYNIQLGIYVQKQALATFTEQRKRAAAANDKLSFAAAQRSINHVNANLATLHRMEKAGE